MFEHRLDEGGIELVARTGGEELECLGRRQGAAVGAVAEKRVEDIRDGDDPAGDRDRLAGQAVGAALPSKRS